ncbi:MAG: TIGR00725 family protein [Candidatus Sumerlaeia bacterium]|nr:TIGR00725 family protein [Candidatus Sumerlaeia bacterium]
MQPIIGVIGSNKADERTYALAEDVGRRIAQSGALLLCGGLGGVMEAACKGAAQAGGLTVGILPGDDPRAANPWVKVPIATSLGLMRNYVIARAADVLIAISGSYGTLNEISAALNLRKPVVALDTWNLPAAGPIDPALFFPVTTSEEAVRRALALIPK